MTAAGAEAVRPGLSLAVEVTAPASDGRGLGRAGGLVVFVEGAVPGQIARVRVTAVRKRLAEAVLTDVLRPSPEERPPACPHATAGGGCGACGGCAWQTLRYERQLHWKERMVRDALERVGRMPDPPVRPVLASPAEWGYRNKMEFAFAPPASEAGDAAPGAVLGLRERGSRRIVPVTACRMQTGRTMALLAAMRSIAAAERLTARDPAAGRGLCRFFVIREPLGGPARGADGEEGRPCLAELIVGPDTPPGGAAPFGRRIAAALREAVPSLSGFVLSRRAARADVAYGESTLYREGETFLTERIGPLSAGMSHNAFFQVNTAAAGLLYAEIARLAEAGNARRVWDVYCGVGSIGLYLALAAMRGPDCAAAGKGARPGFALTGIEAMPGGARTAGRNAAALGLENCRFVQGDAGDVLERFAGAPDVLVLDPPRAGLAPDVTRAVLRKAPARLVYVSCDPATFARDAARLAPRFVLRETRPVDLFPQTPHVELVSLFTAR